MQINSLTLWLNQIQSGGQAISLDFYLARFLTEKSSLSCQIEQRRFAFLVLLLSIEVRSGHVCVNLHATNKKMCSQRFEPTTLDMIWHELKQPSGEDWINLCALAHNQSVSDGHEPTPLVLNNDRLYFHRMWVDECYVANYFITTSYLSSEPSIDEGNIVNQLFSHDDSADINWQKVAVAVAMTKQVAIISGGPGTGKTTTAAKILAALILMQQSIQGQSISSHSIAKSHLRIIAAAPTGKAAARLSESLGHAINALAVAPDVASQIPTEAVTLHRLLGAKADRNEFIYNKTNLLHVDVLLVDEASMIDLSMMANLIAALPKTTKLILLGDKEQLSSVEAGAVFGDLCQLSDHQYSMVQSERLNRLTGYSLPLLPDNKPSIADSICLLQKSYRFSDNSGIGRLANSIRDGDISTVRSLLFSSLFDDIDFQVLDNQGHYEQAIARCVENYQFYLKKMATEPDNIGGILHQFSQFRLICPLREGTFGVTGLNRIIENRLNSKKLIHQLKHDQWYAGRPIMILRNSASLGIYNGDIGITLASRDNPKKLRVYFMLSDGSIKGFSPFQLPLHETAYAMTVHKSQGSEFNTVSIILPTEFSPILTRSLLYTAVTRAKQKLLLYSSVSILERTINSQVERQSGLVDLL